MKVQSLFQYFFCCNPRLAELGLGDLLKMRISEKRIDLKIDCVEEKPECLEITASEKRTKINGVEKSLPES